MKSQALRRALYALFLLLFWIVGVVFVAWAGAKPDTYMRARIPFELAPHTYAWSGVLSRVFLMTLELGLIAGILLTETVAQSWIRTAIAFVVSVGFIFVAPHNWMHEAPYQATYAIWLVGVTLGFFVIFLGTLTVSLWARTRT